MSLIHTFQSAHNKAKQQAPSKWLLLNLFKFDNMPLQQQIIAQCSDSSYINAYTFFLGGGELIEFKNTTCLLIS